MCHRSLLELNVEFLGTDLTSEGLGAGVDPS